MTAFRCLQIKGGHSPGTIPPPTVQRLGRLAAVVLWAPAAGRWARPSVLSRKRGLANLLASNGKPAQRCRPTPEAAHRRKRGETTSHGPTSAGKSRQRLPVRALDTTASMPRRARGCGGLPTVGLTHFL
jgi:hypothetical protein